MAKFNKGDKVRFISTKYPSYRFTVGNIYEVRKDYKPGDRFLSVTMDDQGSTENGWNHEFFVLVEPEFKVGDTIYALNRSTQVDIGEAFTVTQIQERRTGGLWLRFVNHEGEGNGWSAENFTLNGRVALQKAIDIAQSKVDEAVKVRKEASQALADYEEAHREPTFAEKLDKLGVGAVVTHHNGTFPNVRLANGDWVGPSGQTYYSNTFNKDTWVIRSEGVSL
jgi:hypothetical protein